MPMWSMDDPQTKKHIRGKMIKMYIKYNCFGIDEYLKNEFGHGTYLELKSSNGAFDCLNITPVSLLGFACMAGQGP